MYFSQNNVRERFSHHIVRIVVHLSLKAHCIQVGFIRVTRQRCFTTHKPHAGRPVDNALDHAACSRWDNSVTAGGRWEYTANFLSLVILTFDLWPWQSISSERETKHVVPVNLAQILSAVPEIFDSQTKNEWKKVTDSAKTEPYLRAVKIRIQQQNVERLPMALYILRRVSKTTHRWQSGQPITKL